MFERRDLLRQVAAAVSDGEQLPWPAIDAAAQTPHERSVVQQLRGLAGLVRQRAGHRHRWIGDTSAEQIPAPWRAIQLLAAVHVAVALGAAALSGAHGLTALSRVQTAIVMAFAGAALLLQWGGRRDQRARLLGHVYLLWASAFCRPLIEAAAASWPTGMLHALSRGPYPEAFLGLAFWTFAREFPRATRFTSSDRVSRVAMSAAAAIGLLLFVNSWGMAWRAQPPAGAIGEWLWLFRRTTVPFWNVEFALMLLAIGMSVWRARLTSPDERQRSIWFLAAFAAGVLPVAAVATARALGWRTPTVTGATPFATAVDAVVLVAILSMPFTMAYAVIVHRVVSVRVALSRTARYVLARHTLAAVTLLPLLIPLFEEYRGGWTMEGTLDSPATRLASWIMLAGGGLLLIRDRLLALVDRLLLGRRMDQPALLARATEAISHQRTSREVAFEASRQLGVALAVRDVAVASLDGGHGWSPLHGAFPLPPHDSALIALMEHAATPLWCGASPLVELLPPADSAWLLRAGFDVIARIPSPRGELAGFIGLGARDRGRPYTDEDLALVAAIASTTGLALHRPWVDQAAPVSAAPDDHDTEECHQCGTLGTPPACGCTRRPTPARLPALVAGKFKLRRRLGQGGMGVVYLADDIQLQRAVALKTLPQVSGAATAAMLAEAQTMAAVEHPNLAVIYGLEIWRSTPILVVEYLAGGILSDRIAAGAVPGDRVWVIGAELADALAALHASSILHRDIKPSNVGFARSGATKLLDFGVARIVANAVPATAAGGDGATAGRLQASTAAGTPLYLPPEALAGAAPDIFVDLWGLSVVLFEAMTGAYPFRGRTRADVLSRLRSGRTLEWQAAVPQPMTNFFIRALHPDPRRRPQSARELADWCRRAQTSTADLQRQGV